MKPSRHGDAGDASSNRQLDQIPYLGWPPQILPPQVLRVLPPHLTVAEVAAALPTRTGGPR